MELAIGSVRRLRIPTALQEQLKLFGLGILFGIPALRLLVQGDFSLLTVLLVAGAFIIGWSLNQGATVALALSYLFLLGDIRRFVNMYAGYPRLDPLLLIGPGLASYIVLPIVMRLRVVDKLSKAMLALSAIMLMEVVNPRQGSILVGLAGAMFLLIPICWFWISRQFATERLVFLLLYRVVLPLGICAALLGFYQTYIGFLPWEQLWIKHAIANGYVALGLAGGHIRSFGFSVNSAEFGTLLMLSSVCTLAAVFSGRRAYGLLLPLLVTAQFYASMRGLILKTVLAAVIMWAVRGRDPKRWIGRLIVGSVLGFGMFAYSVKHAASDPSASQGKTTADVASSHVTQGLAHPLDARYSTAGLHSQMFFGGIAQGFKNPLGMGLGIVTLGAARFGGEGTGSSEVDISDIFTCTGLIGGCTYLLIMALIVMRLFNFLQTGPRLLGLALLGILIGMMGEWIPLGQYAAGPLVWFCVGFLSKQTAITDPAPETVISDPLDSSSSDQPALA